MPEFVERIWPFVSQYPLLFLGSGLVLATLCWKQPRQVLRVLLIIGVLCVIAYLLSAVTHFAVSSFEIKTQLVGKP